MQSFAMISYICAYLYEAGFDSHEKLKELDPKFIEGLFKENGVTSSLKEELTEYLNLLFSEHEFHYYKKMILEKTTRNKLNWMSSYLLALYAGTDKAYRNLPLLLKLLIEKLDIQEYKYIPIEEIVSAVYKNYDINTSTYKNKTICEISHKIENKKYDRYDEKYNVNFANVADREEFSVWAEHRVLDEQREILRGTKYTPFVKWVAREYGDGYGFDILSIDKHKGKEMLIEVKSGLSNNFYISEREVKVMRSCKYKNADYYISKWTFNKDMNEVDQTMYLYNPELDMLVDNNNNYYKLQPFKDLYNSKVITKYNPIKTEVKTKTLTR